MTFSQFSYREGSETTWYGDSHERQGQWDLPENKMVQQFEETGHPIFTDISALNLRALKRRQKSTIHFNETSTNTELLFQTIHSATQLRIYGAATNWCSQFDLKDEEKGPNAVLMNSKVLITVESQEVEWFTANSSTWKQGAGTHQFSCSGAQSSNDTVV